MSLGEKSKIIHVVIGSETERAARARMLYAMGYHAEIYESVTEFLSRSPSNGLVFVHEDSTGRSLEFVESMKSAGFWLPVIACCRKFDADLIISGIKSGVTDFILDNYPTDVISKKIEIAISDAEVIKKKYEIYFKSISLIDILSNREKEVLSLLSEGKTSKEMARKLNLSPRTVEIHRRKILQKFNVNSTAEAINIKFHSINS